VLDYPIKVKNPKLAGNKQWYRYYAGYSEEFVEDALSRLQLEAAATVFDPWNGAGTTSAVASRLGYYALGADINPALVIVARARSASVAHWFDVQKLLRALNQLRLQQLVTKCPLLVRDDPLRTWLGPNTVNLIRTLEWLGCEELEATAENKYDLDAIKPRSALWYVALFLTVRKLLHSISGTNPTWVKVLARNRVLRPRNKTVLDLFNSSLNEMGEYLKENNTSSICRHTGVSVFASSSTNLASLKDRCIDAIITSPPYCTRIDYAVYCAPEFAVISHRTGLSFAELRNDMIGSPLVGRKTQNRANWGADAEKFLDAVWAHPSKASMGYYFNYFTKYFAAMQSSITELSRVAKPGCNAYVVVQSSFYKDVYLDLPAIITDMFGLVGWALVSRDDFQVAASFSYLNPKTRLYAKNRKVVESVIRFSREEISIGARNSTMTLVNY
jgi:DNA modification methylase